MRREESRPRDDRRDRNECEGNTEEVTQTDGEHAASTKQRAPNRRSRSVSETEWRDDDHEASEEMHTAHAAGRNSGGSVTWRPIYSTTAYIPSLERTTAKRGQVAVPKRDRTGTIRTTDHTKERLRTTRRPWKRKETTMELEQRGDDGR